MRLEGGALGGSLAGRLRGLEDVGEGGVVGESGARVEPAALGGEPPEGGRPGAAHELVVGDPPIGLALAHAHQRLSVVVHLEAPVGHLVLRLVGRRT